MIILATCSTFYGCKEKNAGDDSFSEKKTTKNQTSFNTNFDGQLYSIPSPVPTILKIHALNYSFDSLLLHPTTKINGYKNKTDQAINFGIYCADIIYTSINQKNKECLSFLEPVQHLAKELNLSTIFNIDFAHQFKRNVQQENELLDLINSRYSKANFLLKANDSKNTSALILTGSWIKSIYISTQLYKDNPHPQLLKHIGQQKQSLKAVLEMIEKYNINGQNDKYIAHLSQLNDLFQSVEMSNEFIASSADRAKKTTLIKNKIEIKLEPEIAQQIIDCVENMHKEIISA